MDIIKLPPASAANNPVADPKSDLLNRLQQLGSIPARVVSIDNGQASLMTRLGEITGKNALKLKVGDTIQIKLGGDKQNPVLKVAPALDQGSLLPANKFPKLLPLLLSNRPTTAVVVNQQGGNTLVKLGNTLSSLPLQSQFKTGQLLKITNRAASGTIEIKPVNHQQVLKSGLAQLISALPKFSANNKLLPLLQLLQTSVKATTANIDQAPPSTTGQNSPAAGSLTTAIPRNIQTLVSGLEFLIRSLPTIATLDQRTIQKWVELATESTLGNKSTRSTQTPNLYSVLRQLPQSEQGLAQLVQLLLKPNLEQAAAVSKQMRETGFEDNELFMSQLRDAIKTTEQSLNQQLFQQTSLRFQQEFQQPVAFNLNIPYTEQQTVKSLQLKIRQKRKEANPENQAWEIQLSFEFGLLGLISTHILLDTNRLSTSFWAVEADTKVKIEDALPEFKQQLVNSGFDLGQITCYLGIPSGESDSDFSPLPESLLDIKV